MKFVALLSGGKDSCYAMHLVAAESPDNELVAIANLLPESPGIETNSYMFQTVGQDVLELQAKALRVPLYQKMIKGKPINTEMDYQPSNGDEVEDLYELLREIQNDIKFEAICCGAIHSNYQRLRAENVCKRLGIKLLSPLWGRDQQSLLREMIDFGIEAILIKTAAMGLVPKKHLGRTIKEMFDELVELNRKYGLNVCGEGGEYETMTLNCPMFGNKRIIIDDKKIIHDNFDEIAPVSYLKPIQMHIDNI